MKHDKTELRRCKGRMELLEKQVRELREREQGYKELHRMYGAYIALLLMRSGANAEKPECITRDQVRYAMDKLDERLTVDQKTGDFLLYSKEMTT